MSHRHNPDCTARSFQGFTASHEVMYDDGGDIETNGDAILDAADAFVGTFRFMVR